jgi:2-succinyl-5-enolpyruvyl-6-hydroxy-3-cyclohexene-1-carboxylate synthase
MTALDSYLLLRAMVDEFVRCGMRQACTSPGSRNTPIVLTLARDTRLESYSHIDERCSGFFALGAAKASGLPVAITCTSGTAAVNLAPAVTEAHEAAVPMILLTADRPPELRDVGAGQTIDQIKLYGDSVKWFFELGVPEATPERLRWARSLACRAFWVAVSGRPGPVHLNIPLPEPLVLDAPLPDDEPGGGGRVDGSPWMTLAQSSGTARSTPREHRFGGTVFVAGELGPDPALGAQLASFAERAGAPLLADPLSGARRGDAAIAHYDLILRDPGTIDALKPELVCRVGELPTSKPLRQWIDGLHDAHHVTYETDGRWSDPTSRVRWRSAGGLQELFDRVASDDIIPADPTWLQAWRAADAAVHDAIGSVLTTSGLSEPVVSTILPTIVPSEATLFVAASMPIRDIEEFAPVRAAPPRVMANRGANGIDGTISSAFGVAATTDTPVVLLIGDLALTHDIGGLLAATRTGLKLTIVLVDNGGGGIFDFLPIATQRDVFEGHVATPSGLDFARAAELFSCDYLTPTDVDAFRSAVMDGIESARTTLIHVRTERATNRVLHAEIERAALGALRTAS